MEKDRTNISDTGHIDVTFDLETVATTPNAAVMQIAAVAWFRDNESPFIVTDSGKICDSYVFNEKVDLRSCVVDGFDFDMETVRWWSRCSDAAKNAVTSGFAEPLRDVAANFISWLETLKNHGESICLFCQGMDFDGAILRNICAKYGMQLPFKYQQFRDCRTLILEAAAARVHKQYRSGMMPAVAYDDILADDSKAYRLYDKMPEEFTFGSAAHDAIFDAVRSSWNTWQALNWMRT